MVLYNVINTVGLLKFVKSFASKNIVNREKWLYSKQNYMLYVFHHLFGPGWLSMSKRYVYFCLSKKIDCMQSWSFRHKSFTLIYLQGNILDFNNSYLQNKKTDH